MYLTKDGMMFRVDCEVEELIVYAVDMNSGSDVGMRIQVNPP